MVVVLGAPLAPWPLSTVLLSPRPIISFPSWTLIQIKGCQQSVLSGEPSSVSAPATRGQGHRPSSEEVHPSLVRIPTWAQGPGRGKRLGSEPASMTKKPTGLPAGMERGGPEESLLQNFKNTNTIDPWLSGMAQMTVPP